jgi:hypothetical protein
VILAQLGVILAQLGVILAQLGGRGRLTVAQGLQKRRRGAFFQGQMLHPGAGGPQAPQANTKPSLKY